VVFSKCDRGVRGEIEFGLTPDGRVYGRRFAPIVFTVPEVIVVGEEFVLLFSLLGAGGVGKDDWIGVYPVGAANSAVKLRWYKVNGTHGSISWSGQKGPVAAGNLESLILPVVPYVV
jgi:hypothetical protein